jgi:hypothetical protein
MPKLNKEDKANLLALKGAMFDWPKSKTREFKRIEKHLKSIKDTCNDSEVLAAAISLILFEILEEVDE